MPANAQSQSAGDNVVDPDIDLRDPAQRTETLTHRPSVLVAIALGGVLGALARYGLGVWIKHGSAHFPWSTLVINASGCLAIGVLMTVLLSAPRAPYLCRPFLATGFLGGYTTYSTFATDVVTLVDAHRIVVALAYLVLTLVSCAVAVWVASAGTHLFLDRLRRETTGNR